MIGGKFAPLTIMDNEDTDLDSMITCFNTAVTKTASAILGKHRRKKKKPGSLQKFLICATKERELRKKRFEPEGSEKYKKVNIIIKSCMEKAKENWIRKQCSGTEDDLRKNNSKRAYQLMRLDHCERSKSYYCPGSYRKMPHRGTRDTEPMDIILLSKLYNHKASGDPSWY